MKKNIKKIAFLLVAVLSLSVMAGCGSNNGGGESGQVSEQTTGQTESVPQQQIDDEIAAEAMKQPKRTAKPAELIPVDDIIKSGEKFDDSRDTSNLTVFTKYEIDKPFVDAMGGNTSLENYQTFVNFAMSIAPENITEYGEKLEGAGALTRNFNSRDMKEQYMVSMHDQVCMIMYAVTAEKTEKANYLPFVEEFVRRATGVELVGSEYWNKVSEEVKTSEKDYSAWNLAIMENHLKASSLSILMEKNGLSINIGYNK